MSVDWSEGNDSRRSFNCKSKNQDLRAATYLGLTRLKLQIKQSKLTAFFFISSVTSLCRSFRGIFSDYRCTGGSRSSRRFDFGALLSGKINQATHARRTLKGGGWEASKTKKGGEKEIHGNCIKLNSTPPRAKVVSPPGWVSFDSTRNKTQENISSLIVRRIARRMLETSCCYL